MQNKKTHSAGGLTRKGENIISALIAITVIAAVLVLFGYENTKLWLTSPIVWHDPDDIEMELVDKEESGSTMKLRFLVLNFSGEDYSDYHFYVTCGANTLRVSSFLNPAIASFAPTPIEVEFAEGGSMGRFYQAVKGRSVEELRGQLQYHVKDLWSHGGVVYRANGWLKIVLLLAVAVLSGILATSGIVRSQGLRIALKVLCAPAALAILTVVLFLAIAGNNSPDVQRDVDTAARKRAAEQYKRQASLKAGATMHGSTRDAAFAQGQMDKAMADMVAGSKNSAAKEEYKRQAMLKAGAAAHGKTQDAARAQARMDKALADMLRDMGDK